MKETSIIFAFLAICYAIFYLMDRAEKKAAFRQQCREQSRERYRKTTGWERLDTLNANLYGAYQRMKTYE
jgi:hypothetical protein